MSDDFENQLRRALRRVEPEEDFTNRLMSRIESAPARSRIARFPRWFAAVAASAVLGVLVIHHWQVAREAQGLEARRQLIEALRMTSEKLDAAYQVVNSQPKSETGPS